MRTTGEGLAFSGLWFGPRSGAARDAAPGHGWLWWSLDEGPGQKTCYPAVIEASMVAANDRPGRTLIGSNSHRIPAHSKLRVPLDRCDAPESLRELW